VYREASAEGSVIARLARTRGERRENLLAHGRITENYLGVLRGGSRFPFEYNPAR